MANKTSAAPAKASRRTTPAAPRQSAPTEVTSASEWKKETVEGTLVRVPSGKVVRMISPGMQAFLKNGTIPNGLLPFVQELMQQGKPNKPGKKPEVDEDKIVADVLADGDKLKTILDLADDVTIECVLEPHIDDVPRDDDGEVIPRNDPRRNPDCLYIDEVDFQDKMFIFNVAVGGPASVEKFREGPGAPLASLSKRQALEPAAE